MPPGTLFVVATPIGNLEDITLRALRVLREVELIAAEDTRRTAKLLARHAISTPTISFHEHNTRARLPQLTARLQAGARIAMVSDAGTPGVSDPGVELVRACVDAGIPVDPVPGVSAPLTAAIASGFPLVPLTILGFAPSRSKDRSNWLLDVCEIRHTVTFFEAPHRIAKTLQEAVIYFGERPIIVGRELTKLHQEFLRGTAASLADRFVDARGELTVVLGPVPDIKGPRPDVGDQEIANMFGLLANNSGRPRRNLIAQLAKTLGKSSRDVYAAIERTKKLAE